MPRPHAKKAKPKTKPIASRESAGSDADRPAEETKGYAVRCKIAHPLSGNGIVTTIDGNELTIMFEDGRVKQT